VANKPKNYDLKAADRRRTMLIRIGLTAVVILFAAGLVFWIVTHKKPTDAMAISASNPTKLVKGADGQPAVVLSLYEDFLCPHCGTFEKNLGPTVHQLIDSGAVQADYYMVAILDRGSDNYSSRSASAAYCVAEFDTSPTKDAFRRFHDKLFVQQPSEMAGSYPSNEQLIEMARQAGLASEELSGCINGEKYIKMVRGLAAAEGVSSTPTIKINGQTFAFSDATTPEELIAKVTQITGNVPGLPGPAVPSPPPPAPAPAAP
jgi:protein-disulfide isomerase